MFHVSKLMFMVDVVQDLCSEKCNFFRSMLINYSPTLKVKQEFIYRDFYILFFECLEKIILIFYEDVII